METQFWIDRWTEGKTAFHQTEYNPKLVKYFPTLKPQDEQRVIVPLCGKSKDLLYLHSLGLVVHGIELYEKAVEDFFTENSLGEPVISQDQEFKHYSIERITISCGNFLELSQNQSYDFIYDRAALVALPSHMRKIYASVIKNCLKKGGKYLLIAYDYDQLKMEGPPFSVSEKEIHELYDDQFFIKLVESDNPEKDGSRIGTLEGAMEKVYLLEKL